jgi:cytochrome c oxidase cbb3-type subunit 3
MKAITRITTALFTLLVSPVALAQDASSPAGSFWSDPVNHPLFTFYVMVGFIFIVLILVLLVAVYMLSILNMFIRKAAEEKAAKEGRPYVAPVSWWKRVDRTLTDAVPLGKEETVMLDHNYDGIRELDNHLPPWWKWLFYATIIWGAVYLVVYHVTDNFPLMEAEFNNEMATATKAKPAGVTIDENTVEVTTDAAILQNGKDIFATNCASCHRADGGGMIGPNLTDAYWLHGGSIKNVFATVANGVPNTNMIPWKGALSPEKIRDVSNYVLSLQGTNPAEGKAAEGELYQPEQPAAPADSISAAVNP